MASLFSLPEWSARRAVPRAPDGVVLYAIGDIHGRADLLAPLIEALMQDASSQRRAIVVGLGDYVDRGPEARRVVDLLLQLGGRPGIEVHFLRGNHEQILLDFIADPGVGPGWSKLGGGETLRSYGVSPPAADADEAGWRGARDAFLAALPPDHRLLFERLELSFTCGDYFFAHAGARPGVPFERQDERDLMWIRAPFLENRRRLGKVVVHGHTPAEEAYADHRRIGLDTGAFMSGVLSACRFEGESRRLIQAVETHGGGPAIRTRAF